jgi:nitrite reductase (NADH) large subunit
MPKKKLAIIGNGMGACRLLDELASRNAKEHYEITVFGEEPGGAYNRIMLGHVLAGEPPDAIVTKTPEWYDRNAMRLIAGNRVTRIDTLRKTAETADGQSRRFDLFVLATGSQPLVPPLEGMLDEKSELRPGAFVYRTIADCLRMREYARPGDSAIVVGGGLLGLEAAKVLCDRGLHVTVVHVSPTLMNAQLDVAGGGMLCRHIEKAGIFVRTGRTVEAAYGEERLQGIILDDGTSLPADLILLACGVRPRIELARASGIPVNRGIVVNDALATQVPGVYAFGECAEHRGKTYGLVTPVWEQAAVLADILTAAKPLARYQGSKLYSRLKVAGVDVASMGILEPELESDQVVQVVEDRRNTYRKLVIRDGQLVGAMLVGNTASAGALVQTFDRGDPLPEDPLAALCSIPAAATSGMRLICNCNKVSEAALKEAILAGADSVDEVGRVTKAGTGCGSCKAEIGQIVASLKKPTLSLEAVN